jgi:hypothetical protein
MGLLRGVAVEPGTTEDDIFIRIDVPLDHALRVTLDPPAPGPRGPDRLRGFAAIQVQDQGYALLPNCVQSRTLSGDGMFSFVGVPPLVGTLAGTSYVLGARAVTGTVENPPLSVIGRFATTSSSEPLDLGGFVPLPVITEPAANEPWDLQRLLVAATASEEPVDLTVIEIKAGGGLSTWTLVAPGAREEIVLPNLRELDPKGALPGGLLTIRVTHARISDFVYGSLRYRELAARGWNAHATDVVYSRH